MTISSGLELPARRYPSSLEAMEDFHRAGWTDGLPIVPPTRPLVDAMLAGCGRSPDEVLGELPERRRTMQVWQAATYAVMAGCRPEHFAIVLASWEAMFDPGFNIHGVVSSSGGAAVLGIVSGPAATDAGMNAGIGVLGPGNRANASIGRAVRLGVIAGLGAGLGGLDASSFGHPGKYTYHVAESVPPLPWEPLHRRQGFPSDVSSVTVLGAEAPRQVTQRTDHRPVAVLDVLAASIRAPAQNITGPGTYVVVLLGPEHAAVLIDGGWTQQQVVDYLAEHARPTVDDVLAAGFRPAGEPEEDGRYRTVVPENIVLVTAGGAGAGWSVVIRCWTQVSGTRPVTRAIAASPTAGAGGSDPPAPIR